MPGINVEIALLVLLSLFPMAAAPALPLSEGERCLEKEVVVPGTLDQVWHCFTTEEGLAAFFSPDSKIALRPGGPYELYMGMTEPDEQGKRGSEGCKTLSFIPKEMLSFEWAFPPSVPGLRRSGVKTHVVLRFEALDGKVRVRLSHLGWQEGEDWDKGYAYFDKAWSFVLENLKKHLEKHPDPGAAHPAEDPTETKKWVRGRVTVVACRGPRKRQDFEIDLPVPVREAWRAIATTEGLREHFSPGAKVELKPFGAYALWPGATNKVLSYLPEAMLSTSGSAPPEFPTVRKGGTWSAYFIEPAGEKATRLRLAVVGWQEGEEWDRAFEYFLENNPVFLNDLYKKVAGKERPPEEPDR